MGSLRLHEDDQLRQRFGNEPCCLTLLVSRSFADPWALPHYSGAFAVLPPLCSFCTCGQQLGRRPYNFLNFWEDFDLILVSLASQQLRASYRMSSQHV